jgi:hypothetical protein
LIINDGTDGAQYGLPITFDNIFNPSLYSEYELRFQSIQPATDNVDLRVQLRSASPADITSTHRNNRVVGRIDATQSPTNDANLGGTSGWTIAFAQGTTDANRRTSGALQIMPFAGEWTIMKFHL